MRTRRLSAVGLVLGAWLGLGAGHLHAVSIEALTARALVQEVKISPEGTYLAVRVFQEGSHSLLFLDRKRFEPVGAFRLGSAVEVGAFHWVSDERVVGEILEAPPSMERPEYYGELFAVNADGSQSELLFGYRSGEQQVGTLIRRRSSERAWAEIVDVLPGDDRNILISSTPWSRSGGRIPQLRLLNVYTGINRPRLVPAKRSGSRFYTDGNGNVSVITSRDADGFIHVQALPPGGEWLDFPASAYGDAFSPVAIAGDGASLYVLDDPDSDRIGLHSLSLDGTRYEPIYEHERVDITDVLRSTDGNSIYGVRVDDGYPSYMIFSSAHEEATVFRMLLETFPGYLVSIQSRSRDARYWIVKTETDVDEGTFYLFDREENELHVLFESRDNVDPELLSPMTPVQFDSFDGQRVHGYFTAARTEDPGPAPMVVLVHGGPAMRDFWGYDAEVQVLATRGFSVLQINYRGSTGYGRRFESLGHRQWGDAVQRDIIAGTRWAIDQGLAERGRIAIMGSSFGAYSAVQSAILAPDLFACVVANAGVYDLPLLYRQGDIRTLWWGTSFLEERLGRDRDELAAYSPVNRVEALNAPVFIAHGRQDQRAPFAHARNLRRALDRHDKPYEWFIKRREGHGFYSNDNLVEFLEAATEFLHHHLQ